MVVRLARGDVNMPDFDGFAIEQQIPEVLFEAATYTLLRNEAEVRASRLLYSRAPLLKPGSKTQVPDDLSGRRMFVFERSDGTNNVWEELDAGGKVRNNTQSVRRVLRASRSRCLISLHACVLPYSTIAHRRSSRPSTYIAASLTSNHTLSPYP